jgi:hypothetical protein
MQDHAAEERGREDPAWTWNAGSTMQRHPQEPHRKQQPLARADQGQHEPDEKPSRHPRANSAMPKMT